MLEGDVEMRWVEKEVPSRKFRILKNIFYFLGAGRIHETGIANIFVFAF